MGLGAPKDFDTDVLVDELESRRGVFMEGPEPTGEELFDRFRTCMATQGVHMDEWDDFGPEDQDAWDDLAKQVRFKKVR